MQSGELEVWLQSLPLNEPVDIDGELVYLKVEESGAELGVQFMEQVTSEQLQAAMQAGFQNALEFDAGWSLSIDGTTLLLTQWLPDVSGWAEVPEALEQLLNQIELLRSQEAIAAVKSVNTSASIEQRIRSKLTRPE
jgi:hypothetical protein